MKTTEIDTLLTQSLARTMGYANFAPEQQLGALKDDLRSLFGNDGPNFLTGQRERVRDVIGAATADQAEAMKAYCKLRTRGGATIDDEFADLRRSQ